MPTPIRLTSFVIFVLAAGTVFGQYTTNRLFAVRAEQVCQQAQAKWGAHPDDAAAASAVGRTAYDWAEFATNSEQRAAIAQIGISACKALVARDPNSVAGHYFLGMDYGELAEAEAPSMAAYKLIREIEHEFKIAGDLEERFDNAGPLRSLGLLYRDAPGWPISIGSRRKARELLERAALLSPDYPENPMNLVESYVLWRQADEAQAAWRKLLSIWAAAQTNLAGPAWEADWSDWRYRREVVKDDFRKAFKRELAP
jgi:tetratricopeptide (TPR) repeat protein